MVIFSILLLSWIHENISTVAGRPFIDSNHFSVKDSLKMYSENMS